MSEVYILKNQYDQFLDKQGQWVDQADTVVLYRTPYKDEAINIMVEHSVKNPDARVRIVPCELNEKGHLSMSTPVVPENTPDADVSEASNRTPSNSASLDSVDSEADEGIDSLDTEMFDHVGEK